MSACVAEADGRARVRLSIYLRFTTEYIAINSSDAAKSDVAAAARPSASEKGRTAATENVFKGWHFIARFLTPVRTFDAYAFFPSIPVYPICL